MNEIDILMCKEGLSRGVTILQGKGYEVNSYFDLADANIDIKHIPPMFKPNSPPVEVHWTLLEEDEPFSIDM